MAKTTLMFSVLGKTMHWGPRKPVMYLCPTEDLARMVSKARVQPMIERCPELAAMIDRKKSGQMRLYFGNTMVNFAWMGSPTQMSSNPICTVLIDEIDQNPTILQSHGNAVTMADARTRMYGRQARMLNASTPTIDGVSQIWHWWEQGSMHIYCGRCEHCGEWFYPQADRIRWPKGCPADEIEEAARLVCPHCGCEHDQKPPEARYIAHRKTGPLSYVQADVPTINRIRSFWAHGLWGPMSTIGILAGKLAAAYRAAEESLIQDCLNLDCGELYRIKGERPAWEAVAALRIAYPKPLEPQRVTMGVDVQRDSLYYVVRGWFHGWESWRLDAGQLMGSTGGDDVWNLLEEVRQREYYGRTIDVTLIDSGFNPGDKLMRPEHRVHEFCRTKLQCHPSRGVKTHQRHVARTAFESGYSGRQKRIPGFLVNTYYWKQWLYDRIRRDPDLPGAWRIPLDATEDYCRQVVNEELITLSSGRMEWRPTGNRDNHYMDCEVLCAAGAELCNVGALAAPDAEQQEPEPEPTGSLRRRSF